MSRDIDIEILGKVFTFHLGEGISAQEFMQVAAHVEGKIRKIKEKTNELDPFRLALLTAVNISQELHALKREDAKLREILGHIDQLLTPVAEGDELPIHLSS